MADAVEIAARALWIFERSGTPWKKLSPEVRDHRKALARAALTAVLDAVTLEWERETDTKHYADTPFGRYVVEFWAAYGWTCHSPLMRSITEDSREDAQAAALADYRARLADYRARLARALGMEEE